jgi:RNA polymerase sigma-B factor
MPYLCVLHSKLSDDELVQRLRSGDSQSHDELVKRYQSLAFGLARRYSYTSEYSDDLEQVAMIGLVAAIKRFDPARGKPLRAFAVPTILGELRRHFRDTGWAVHMPRPLQERSRDVREATAKLTTDLQRSPSPREVAEFMDISVEDVIESLAVRRAYRPESLDAPPRLGDDDSPRSWDSIYGCDEDGYNKVDAGMTVARAMQALPDRERQIIRLRFGSELSQSEIGDALGISQMHVSRLLRRGLDRVATIVKASPA